MASYKHTQIGYLMLSFLLAVVLPFGRLMMIIQQNGGNIDGIIVMVMLFVVFILASFSTLTVTVDEQNLLIKFGYGIFRKTFPLAEIASVKIVKNHWYYGWGIRRWFWPKMWIYPHTKFMKALCSMSTF